MPVSHNNERLRRRKLLPVIISVVLILSGVIIIVFALEAKLKECAVQSNLRSIYAKQAKPAETTPAAGFTPIILPGDNMEYDEMDDSLSSPLKPVCLLKIPKISLDVAVAQGTNNSVLRYAVGHFEGTAFPGDTGNFCLAGHRSYTSGQFFNRLDEIEIGDELIIDYFDNTYTYIVSDIFVVRPDDIWVLDPTSDSQITLVTCTPIRVSTHRLIIRGFLQPK